MKVLLYYKYTPIAKTEKLMRQQKKLCESLHILGRILISDQGINGTICGEEEAIEAYKKATEENEQLGTIEWKEDAVEQQIFPRLRVAVREEIVTLGLKSVGKDPDLKNKAEYIEPLELKNLYEKGEEFYIIDARNEYESRVGKFKDAITPEIENFRDFPEYVKAKLSHLKEKPVVTYCTGGIRCEKASAFLKESGFKNVRQLHGGIHQYGKVAGGKNFQGEMYVFDGRVTVPVNTVNPEVVSQCLYCGTKIARFVNCAIKSCNDRMICCPDCQEQHSGLCKQCNQN